MLVCQTHHRPHGADIIQTCPSKHNNTILWSSAGLGHYSGAGFFIGTEKKTRAKVAPHLEDLDGLGAASSGIGSLIFGNRTVIHNVFVKHSLPLNTCPSLQTPFCLIGYKQWGRTVLLTPPGGPMVTQSRPAAQALVRVLV